MVSPITFIKQTQEELRQVKWPTRDEAIRLTAIVIIISVVVGIYIGGLDYIFAQAIGYILR
jgi:preprotein translocase subunit SecE